MSIAELQKKFIGKIISTYEPITLKELLNWIYLDKDLTPVYHFSEEQLNKLEKAEQQIQDDSFYTNE
ncbi:MAG: hypothetical protein H7320_09690 [Ferruginibacter sp.]|nr:hypothetical protein [Ferruginibacter sp.]